MRILFAVIALLLIPLACAVRERDRPAPPAVVARVDLSRYMGTWYEIARFEHSFQKGCRDSKALYTLKEDGTVSVVNSCTRNGKETSATGTAKVADPATNAKLKVTFFWPFSGDYWIVDLGKDYEYAVVSAPGKDYLWILSRAPRMDRAAAAEIVARLKDDGFAVDRLVWNAGAGSPGGAE